MGRINVNRDNKIELKCVTNLTVCHFRLGWVLAWVKEVRGGGLPIWQRMGYAAGWLYGTDTENPDSLPVADLSSK